MGPVGYMLASFARCGLVCDNQWRVRRGSECVCDLLNMPIQWLRPRIIQLGREARRARTESARPTLAGNGGLAPFCLRRPPDDFDPSQCAVQRRVARMGAWSQRRLAKAGLVDDSTCP
eukprot:11069588-Alexandrium_andersonii.AAC.1